MCPRDRYILPVEICMHEDYLSKKTLKKYRLRGRHHEKDECGQELHDVWKFVETK